MSVAHASSISTSKIKISASDAFAKKLLFYFDKEINMLEVKVSLELYIIIIIIITSRKIV